MARQNTSALRTDRRSNTAALEPLEGRRLFSGSPARASGGFTTRDEIVPGGVILRNELPPIALSPSAKPSRDTAAKGSFDIVLKKGPVLTANAAASAAFEAAAQIIESYFSDPITIVVDAEVAALASGIIGSTGSVGFTTTYTSIRNAVVLDAGANDAIVASLPTAAQFNPLFPTAPANPYSLGGLSANRANLLALGFTPASLDGANSIYDPAVDRDMSITFSTNFPFDYDRSNGITANQEDFVGVAVHEMLHGLGFVSSVDRVDFLESNTGSRVIYPGTLDLFRLQPGVGQSNFTTGFRLLVPGDIVANQVVYDGGFFNPAGIPIAGLTIGDVPMSTGRVNGDGQQASHWKDNEITGVTIGAMDPTAPATGQLNTTAVDVRVMSLIGYNVGTSATPGTPDLVAASDTGNSTIDNLTNRDNSTVAKALQFSVSGTGVGATVQLFDGATLIGTAIANGTTTIVTTNGTVDLTDGVHNITARQTELAQIQSASSAALPVTVDTVAPIFSGSPVFEFMPLRPRVRFFFNEALGNYTPAAFTVVRNNPNPGVQAAFFSTSGNAVTLAFPSAPNAIIPNGDYTATALGSGLGDAAGNTIATNASLNFFYVAGDANRDRKVDFNDFAILQANFAPSGKTYVTGDFDYDGDADFSDFAILQSNFGVLV